MTNPLALLARMGVDASYRIAKPLLFRLDAEEAHERMAARIERLQSMPSMLSVVRSVCVAPSLPVSLFGLSFRNPLGIAAGFDKNGRMISFLEALGFGFVEVGTVTYRPQQGNPRPRMFRFPQHGAIVNRLGFNNEGAASLIERVAKYQSREGNLLPVFINIGKNADVPLEEASADYVRCYEVVAPLADAIVVNVSSPNTASLRDLQDSSHLVRILEDLRSARERLCLSHAIIVKTAPDLTDQQLDELVATCLEHADGISATNTTVDKSAVPEAQALQGGLSGRPLRERATSILRRIRGVVGAEYPLIGVGGIFDGADAAERITAGANLIQAYTGFIYEGPMFAKRLVAELAAGVRDSGQYTKPERLG